MRIIAGKYRGRPIRPPKQLEARPTTDLARESLFNILNNSIDFENTRFLDLFAGTGAISFEMASRGCAHITAVEKNFKQARFIEKVSRELDMQGFQVVKADVFNFMEKRPGKYGLVFADPPYSLENLDEIPDIILEQELLDDDGLFILEHGKTNQFARHPYFVMLKRYGSVHFSFFRKKKE